MNPVARRDVSIRDEGRRPSECVGSGEGSPGTRFPQRFRASKMHLVECKRPKARFSHPSQFNLSDQYIRTTSFFCSIVKMSTPSQLMDHEHFELAVRKP